MQETPDAGRVSDLRGLFWKGVGSEGAVEDGFRTGTPGLWLGAMGAVEALIEALREEAEGRQTENPVRQYTNVSQLVTDYGAEHGRRGGFARAFRGAGG